DRQAMEAVRFDLRWKVALGLPLDHEGFHATSLVKFRARLLLHGKERVVFERSLELASELGLISGQVEQILDSTPMLGAAAVQDTVTLVRSAVRKLLDAVKAADSRAARELRRALRFDYARPRLRPEGDWQDRAARLELLAEVARDAARVLRAVEADELLAGPAIAEAATVLREIIGQEFEVADDDVPRVRAGRRARAARERRSTSRDRPAPMPRPGRAGRRRAAIESPASRAPTASPARSDRGARPVGGGRSGSAAARTCAKPRCRRYPIPPSATISRPPGRA